MNVDEIFLPEPIEFEWDESNQTKLRLRHNISTEEAEQIFFRKYLIWPDEKHSGREKRYQLLGISNNDRVLFIVSTIRKDKIRIISARSASRKERQIYAEKI